MTPWQQQRLQLRAVKRQSGSPAAQGGSPGHFHYADASMDTLQQQRAKLKPVQTSKLAALPASVQQGFAAAPVPPPNGTAHLRGVHPGSATLPAAGIGWLLQPLLCSTCLPSVSANIALVHTPIIKHATSILLRAYNMIQIRMAACCAKITLFPRCFVATSPMSCRVPAMFDLCSAFRCLMCLFSMLALHCCMQLLCAVKVLVCLTSFTQLK